MRRIIFIVIGIVTVVFIVGLLALNQSYDGLIDITTVSKEKFSLSYSVEGIVDSDITIQTFQGTITSLQKKENECVNKDEIILSYKNYDEKTINLKAKIDGYIYSIQPEEVLLKNNDFFIKCFVDYGIYKQLIEEEKCSYKLDNTISVGTISKIYRAANQDNEFEIDIKPDFNNLNLNQKVIVKLPIKVIDGLIVDKRAILKDDEGYFLIKEAFLKDIKHPKDYRIDIKILLENDDVALIEAIGIENLNVCILNEEIKELIFND